MKFSKYEETYISVREVKWSSVQFVDQVVEILRNAKDGITCKEIGLAIWGKEGYTHNRGNGDSHAVMLGHVLSNLASSHFVKFEKVAMGEPISYEETEWVWDEVTDVNNEPRTIRVHDDYGNTYTIDNPRYDWRTQGQRTGHWQSITKYIQPKVKIWYWIGD